MHRRELVSMLGRADIAFHQLVGSVIVFGQHLAGGIEGNGFRAVGCNGLAEFRGDQISALSQPARSPLISG